MKKIAIGILSLALVATLALQPAVSNVSIGNPNAEEGSTSASASASSEANGSGILDVTDTYGDALRAQANDYVAENDYTQYASSRKERKIIVQLEGGSLIDSYRSLGGVSKYESISSYATSREGKKIVSARSAEQSSFLSALNQAGVAYTYEYGYNGIVNGVALTVKENALQTISQIKGVKNIIFSEQYAVPTAEAVSNPVNAYSTGIYDTTGISYTGAGVVVAILDTGLDYTHNAFSTMPRVQSLKKSDIEEAVKSGSLVAQSRLSTVTADQLYINAKVPFQFDYADDDADVFPIASSHGTHVAGIIAGYEETVDYKPLPSDDNMYFNTNENGDPTFKGVAVDAQLAIFKVFSDAADATGGDTVNIIAALNDAVMLGVDVINMSLGLASGFSRISDDDSVNEIYDAIREMGIALIVAAGNSFSSGYSGTYGNTNLASNPDSGTVSSPSVYNGAISVASVSGQLSPYFLANNSVAVYFSNARNSAGKELKFMETLLDGARSKTFRYVVVGGYGEDHNYTDNIISKLAQGNTIAVVSRGNTSFEEKQRIAASYGAVGCIIYNNVSGLINASLGTGYEIPTCTITMDIARQFVSQTDGTITLSEDYKAGPFMSDFSSWGTTSDLHLYPEITAHGGYITSAVLGGYGVYSGTSMATPNVAGISTLIRQYLSEKYPEKSKTELNDLLYQLMMSTATIALNEDGNPYSPRKQGAGLADIQNTINTDAYLYVKGSNKTKLELGDDPAKEGTYVLRFQIKNDSASAKTYRLDKYVMTETMSSDGITVAEKAYMLNDAVVKLMQAGSGTKYSNGKLTVAPGADAELVFKVTLSNADKKYLDEHFVNGMFVEGYIRFIEEGAENNIELSIPWMAFYGDWLDAPMFDKSAYDVSGSYFDSSVPDDEKLQADVYESVVIGKYYRSRGTYMGMGEYIMIREDSDTPLVESSIDKIAVGGSDYSIYEVYAVYAGLLRSAKSVKIVVTDDVTGEVILDKTEYEVGKSSQGRPAFIELGISPVDLKLKNNVKYNVALTAALDYENGERVSGNTWNFSFYVDYEIPAVNNYEIRTVYDRDNNKTVYLDAYISDNHYVQSVQLFSSNSTNGSDLQFLNRYPVPVYGMRNGITKVTLDITNYLDAFKNNRLGGGSNQIGIYLYDYALNSAAYLLPLKWDAIEYVSMTHDGVELSEMDSINLTVGEAYSYQLSVMPGDADPSAVNIACSPSIVEVRDGYIYAKRTGTCTVTVTPRNSVHEVYAYVFNVTVTDGTAAATPAVSVEFASYTLGKVTIDISGNVIFLDCGVTSTLSLSYTPWYATPENLTWSTQTPDIVSVTNRGVITTLKEGVGRVRVSWTYRGVTYVSSLTVRIGEKYKIVSGYLYDYDGADSLVQIPANLGILTVGHYMDNTAGPFYGNTNIRTVIIPSGVTSIGTASFYGCTNLETIFLPSTLEGIGQAAFQGCSKLKNVYWYTDAYWDDDFDAYTFVDSTGKTVRCFAENGSVVGGFDYGVDCTAKNYYVREQAFYMCSRLEAIDLSKATAVFSQAFSFCSALKEVDISNVKYTEMFTFSSCSSLASVTMSKNTAMGDGMFYYCTSLTTVDLYASRLGNQTFSNCTSLREVNVHEDIDVIGSRSFYECTRLVSFNLRNNARIRQLNATVFGNCTALTSIMLNGVSYLGNSVFQGCSVLEEVNFGSRSTLDTITSYPFYGCPKLTRIMASANNRTLTTKTMVVNGVEYSMLYSGSKLVAAPPSLTAKEFDFTDAEGNVVETIGASAYADSSINVDTLIIPEGVKRIEDYAFYGCNFRTLVLPTTLEYLGNQVFAHNYSLVRVLFLGDKLDVISNFTFLYCRALEEVSLPDGVKEFGMSAFRYCTSLRGITLPASLEKIGPFAFADCTQLSDVKFATNASLKTIDYNAFFNDVYLTHIDLPNTLETIGNYAFYYAGLDEITIPGSLKTFGNFAFSYCRYLTDVVIEEGVSYIGYGAFAFVNNSNGSIYYNNVLKNVTLPSTLNIIGPYAFAACNGLESIDLKYVTTIEDFAFLGCAYLTDLGDTDRVLYIGGQAFAQTASLTEVSFPAVKFINSYAFADCFQLEKADIPSCETLGYYVFYECEALTEVVMPKIKQIYLGAFYGCFNLEEVEFPVVEFIGEAAFFASGLKQVTLPATLERLDVAAFAQSVYLEKFVLEEGNKALFTDEDGLGVYRTLANGGYEIIAYAQGSEQTSYTILDGTVRVADWALSYAVHLNRVEIPSTVKRIGAGGFYYLGMTQSEPITYVFRSVQAPELEGAFNPDVSSYSQFYNNFSFALGAYRFHMLHPSNGVGYDNQVYSTYFGKPEEFLEEAAEEGTLALVARIAALDPENLVGDEIRAIRRSYNLLGTAQRAFVTNYDRFVQLEAAYNASHPDTPPEEEPPTENPPEQTGKKGCRGIISGTSAIILTVIMAAVVVIVCKKKQGGSQR